MFVRQVLKGREVGGPDVVHENIGVLDLRHECSRSRRGGHIGCDARQVCIEGRATYVRDRRLYACLSTSVDDDMGAGRCESACDR